MANLKNKCIITVATTGAWPKKKDNPNVPMTPAEIAEDVYDCWQAGAAVAKAVQDSGVDLTLCTFYDLSSIYKKTKNAMILSKVGVVILAMISFVGAVAATLFLSRYTKRAKKNETGN